MRNTEFWCPECKVEYYSYRDDWGLHREHKEKLQVLTHYPKPLPNKFTDRNAYYVELSKRQKDIVLNVCGLERSRWETTLLHTATLNCPRCIKWCLDNAVTPTPDWRPQEPIAEDFYG